MTENSIGILFYLIQQQSVLQKIFQLEPKAMRTIVCLFSIVQVKLKYTKIRCSKECKGIEHKPEREFLIISISFGHSWFRTRTPLNWSMSYGKMHVWENKRHGIVLNNVLNAKIGIDKLLPVLPLEI